MRKSDVMCPTCHAGFQRIELTFVKGRCGNFRCLVCSHAIETLDGSRLVAYRLTQAFATRAAAPFNLPNCRAGLARCRRLDDLLSRDRAPHP